jgi:hypothetical protein
MLASLLARVGSVAAVAAIAVTGATATAGAASAATTHPQRLATHLSIAKVPAVLHHKHVVVIAGDLRSHRIPLRDKVVFLDRKTASSGWVVVGRELTHRFGHVAFVVDPKVNARYMLVFKGSLNFRPSHSRVVIVKARA